MLVKALKALKKKNVLITDIIAEEITVEIESIIIKLTFYQPHTTESHIQLQLIFKAYIHGRLLRGHPLNRSHFFQKLRTPPLSLYVLLCTLT